MRTVICLLTTVSVCSSAAASMWVDPDFEQMVKEAELIAVVEVVEGGAMICKVKVVDVLKGKAPGKVFEVGGYNNAWWPQEAIKKESFAKGETVLMFLRRGTATTGTRARPATKEMFRVPTPSTGDFRIKDGKLYGGWYWVSYPHSSPGVDSKTAVELIRGYIISASGKEPEVARRVLSRKLTVPTVKAVTNDESKENQARAWEMGFLLCAQAAYGRKAQSPAVLAAVKSNNDWVKVTGARAVRSLGASDQALAALDQLLRYDRSYVQAEAARTLVAGRFPKAKAVTILVKSLPKSSAKGGRPTSIMDPLRNTSASGREAMIRALTHYGAEKEARDALIGLIQDEGLNTGVFDALSAHFLKFPSERARDKFLVLYRRCPDGAIPLFDSYLLAEASSVSMKAVSAKLLNSKMSNYDRAKELKRFLEAAKPGDPLRAKTAQAAVRKYRDTGDVVASCAGVLAGSRKNKYVELVADAILNGNMRMFDRGKAVEAFVAGLGRDSDELSRYVLMFLKKFKGAKDSHEILAACIPGASREIADMLKDVKVIDSSFGESEAKSLPELVRQAVDLKLNPPKDDRQRVDAWLGLMLTKLEQGYTSDGICAELVAATPPGLRRHAIGRIRAATKKREATGALIEALDALGAKLTPEEQKTVRFRRAH